MKATSVYEMVAALSEQVGDNKVDHMVESIRQSVEVELNMFMVSLLNTNVKEFEKSYATPQFEGFRDAMADIEQRYRVMDGLERQDLFVKIENVFKGIFLQKFNALGPDVAELVAIRYAGQMIKKVKDSFENPMDPINDLYPADKELYPNASPEVQPLTSPEATAQALDQLAQREPIHPNVPTYRNVY